MKAEIVKENLIVPAPLSARWLVAALLAAVAIYYGVTLIDYNLPEPRLKHNSPADVFIAEIAYEHLVNLTSIGPRVAGSYENEVLAVRVAVEALKQIAREASPHQRLEVELHRADGAFPITFLDGMNTAYRDVSNVVARLSARGAVTSRARAVLLNCHRDTVPDSPGASDDGAGCAVLLETVRALSRSRTPLRHDVVLLINGAEENIMQGSHAFITTHRWAKNVRAFINIEACGAGGREVLFQAGPRDPWIMEVYSGAVPHPFASSLAQEMFERGLIPADTDFRIFRDFGHLSGVDLAWSANGYVYHTALDTAERVPRASLQRTGDNVLALTAGLLSSESMESAVDASARQPVFFDVLGLVTVSCRAAPAAALAVLAALLPLLQIHLHARYMRATAYLSALAYWRLVGAALLRLAAASAAGAGAAGLAAAALHGTAPMSWYSTPWLIAPLYVAPALAAQWWWWARLWRGERTAGLGRPGWARARLAADALGAAWALLVAASAALGLRAGFLPALWPLATAAAFAPRLATKPPEYLETLVWTAAALLPSAQSCYLAHNSLLMFVPIQGRAGSHADGLIGAAASALAMGASCWLLPLLLAARASVARRLAACLAGAWLAAALLVLGSPLGAPYSRDAPQRFMVFHTRRTHSDLRASPPPPGGAEWGGGEQLLYWLPQLDANSPHTVDAEVPELRLAEATPAAECARLLYCGAPYFLPVLALLPRSHRRLLPPPPAGDAGPLARLQASLHAHALSDTHTRIHVNVTGPSHIVAIVSPAAGGAVRACSLLAAAPVAGPRWRSAWGERDTYFFTLHDARASPRPWTFHFDVHFAAGSGAARERVADVSLAGHSMFGESKLAPAHRRLLASLPPAAAATGWGVDLQLYTL